MFYTFKFSIIVPFYNSEKYIIKSINSIINQTLNFQENIQLILVDDGSTDHSRILVEEFVNKYPMNIKYIHQNHSGCSSARNLGLQSATGKYVMFLDSDDFISSNTLKNVYDIFESHYTDIDVVSLPMKYVGVKRGTHYFNKKFTDDEIIDLEKYPDNPQLSLPSSIIKNEIIKEFDFNTDLISFADSLLLNLIILKKKTLGVSQGMYYYRQTYQNINNLENLRLNKKYYFDKLASYEDLINHSLECHNYVIDYIQYVILEDLTKLIENFKINIFNEEELNHLKNLIKDVLKNIDEENISNKKYSDENIKYLLFVLKNESLSVKSENEDLLLLSGNQVIDKISSINIDLYNIHILDNTLHIDGNFSSRFELDDFSLNIILKNGNIQQNYPCETVIPEDSFNNSVEMLSYKINSSYFFKSKIPINNILNSEIKIELNYNNQSVLPHIKLKENILSRKTKNLIILNKKITLFNNYNSIMILPYSPFMKLDIFNHEDFNYNFEFTVVMPVYNTCQYLEEAINSLINQTIGFEENIELIIVDDGSTDNSLDIAFKYYELYPNNIKIFSKTHSGQASARDLGLKYAQGEYINFLDSDDYLDEDTFEVVSSFFENRVNVDIVTIPMEYFERIESDHPLNYKFVGNKVINLNKSHTYPQFSIASSFIRTVKIKEYEFDNTLVSSDDALIINQLLLDSRKLGILNEVTYHYRKRFSEDNLSDTLHQDKKYYTHRLKHFHKHLIDYCIAKYDKVPNFIQFMLISDLNDLLSIPELDIFDNDDELDEFWHYLTDRNKEYDILGYIGDNMILNNRNVNNQLKSFVMFLRKGNFYIHINNKGIVHLKTGNYVIDKFNFHNLWFDIIEIRYNKLYLSGHYVSNFKYDSIHINFIKENKDGNNEVFPCEYFEYGQPDRSTRRYLSIDWKYDYNFNVEVPLDNIDNASFHFELTYDEDDRTITVTPNIGFRVPSGLTEFNKYFVQDSKIVFYTDKKIHIMPYSYVRMLKREYRTLQLISADKQDGYISIIFYRLLYMLLYPFMNNRRIWIINDRLDQADENGIHLFRYSLKQNDGIKKYYILDKNCDDYKKLKKQYGNNILAHNSFKHKIIYLFAEKRIASFLNEAFFNPFWVEGNYDIRKIYCNLITSPWYFLQHGVIYRDLTSHIKRYKYNLALIVTSADFERQSFFDLKYGFPENVVQTLGLPRYDNLKDDTVPNKQILFTPTWRLNLEKDESLFYNSDYYEMLISFLNNEKLFNLLDEYGYKFIFKPHPQLIKHLDDMELNDNIIVSTEESYQKLIKESALMISDFSSVISDFAYLKKPIIYYQKNDDHHFEAFFDYKEQGFGEVIEDEDGVVEKVKYYLENNCEMEDIFKERVTNFFKFNDKNNCKRVYEWILKN